MNIIQQPDLLSLSMNMKEFIVLSSETVSFVLHHGAEEVLSRRYEPGADGRLEIDVRDVVHSRLEYDLQETSSVYVQSRLVGEFTAHIDNMQVSFRVIRGGVDRLVDTPANFLTQNFLTWQPSVKAVTFHSPEFLTYYAASPCVARLKAYFDKSEFAEITLAECAEGNAYTIPLQYATVSGLLDHRLPSYYDVWVENLSGVRLTYIQRFHVGESRSIDEDWILFENSLGGLDTFRAYGELSLNVEHTHNVAEIDERSLEYRIDTERKYSKNTGHLDTEQSRWLLDFFPSERKYLYVGNYMRPIVVVESNVSAKVRKSPANYTFVFKFADARPLLNLPRTDVPAEMLNVTVPEVGSFTIPPRLSEFPRLPLSEGVLFPVQHPYSENWGTTTVGSLVEAFSALLAAGGSSGGVGHTHANIDLLELLSLVKEYLLVAGKKIKAGYADVAGEVAGDKYLRKDQPDRTDYLLQIGEFIDSLTAGKGIGLFPNGRAQLSRVEIRDSLTVLEVIFNRLSAMESDYSFSESGTIDTIELLSDGTYTLHLRKRWENDFTAFDEHDIIYGVVNNLASGEGEYYTSWMRVLHVDTAANTVNVVLYSDSEVPGGKNYPPEPLMVCSRRGNPVNQDRQAYWYLSSNEHCICMLDGVTKPILEEENYSIIIGRLKHLSLFDNLPINYKQSYVYCRGMAIQDILRIDYQGNPVRSENNRGKWNEQEAVNNPYASSQEAYDAVYHYGCKWMCLVSGTTNEPKYASPDWAMIEGNPDFSVGMTSSAGWNFDMDEIVRLYNNGQQPFTVLNLFGRLYNRDVTAHILDSDIEWTRDSGNVTEDNAWAVAHGDTGKVLPLTLNDLGPNYPTMRRCSFIATVLLRDGNDTYTDNYVINI